MPSLVAGDRFGADPLPRLAATDAAGAVGLLGGATAAVRGLSPGGFASNLTDLSGFKMKGMIQEKHNCFVDPKKEMNMKISVVFVIVVEQFSILENNGKQPLSSSIY